MTDTPRKLRIAVIGLGPMGRTVAERIALGGEAHLAALFDPAFAELELFGLTVEASADDLVGEQADVAVVATGSLFEDVEPLISSLVERGIHVVSTCEELAYPSFRNPQLAASLDDRAQRAGVAVVGTGVNPGFVMDALPAYVATAGSTVKSVRIERFVDLSERRAQLREKMGAGLTLEAWTDQGGPERFGHKGLQESAGLTGLSLGWPVTLENLTFNRAPNVVDGVVQGLHESAGWSGHGRELTLEVDYKLDSKSSDTVEISSEDGQTIHVSVTGLHGDSATIARAYNALHVVSGLAPGLRLPLDLPARSRAVGS